MLKYTRPEIPEAINYQLNSSIGEENEKVTLTVIMWYLVLYKEWQRSKLVVLNTHTYTHTQSDLLDFTVLSNTNVKNEKHWAIFWGKKR